jgi:tetratricopeptide (TPR) repeat protein/transcriptional regulator with XRE-family HTH domain
MTTGTHAQPPPGGSRALARLLRELRERALLTQEQLAERAGVSVGTVRGVEAGRIRRPRSSSVRRLADALGLTGREREALVAAARGGQSGPAQPGGGRPSQLPADVAGFTGRVEYLERLGALLPDRAGASGRRGTAVIIAVIDGTGGVGKSALAVHWAHRVADRFPDGQLYVDLRGHSLTPPTRPVQALARLLRALGVEPDKIPVGVDEAAGTYRSLLAGRRALVVLDNAHSAEQVRPLLPGSPGCAVVVTSRDRLAGLVASHGVHQITLEMLSEPEAVALLERILGRVRVAAEPEATAELARLCGYLPLALRIAAANLTTQVHHSVASRVAELRQGDRLAGLEVDGDLRGAVAVAFDHSYQRLAPEARRAFRLLGLAPGPDLEVAAAAALAATTPERAARVLDRLAAAHLLEARGAGRFAFHDLLGLYARRRAAREDAGAERDAAVGRLLGWYLHAADAAARELYPQMLRLSVAAAVVAPGSARPGPGPGAGGRAGALAWLDRERPNLVAAVQHAARHGPWSLAWLLADTLRGYFWLRRHTVDWLAVGRAGLDAARRGGDAAAQTLMRLSLGDAHASIGQYAEAIEHYAAGLAMARQAGWTDCQAAMLGNLGLLYWEIGDPRKAADHQTQALALYRRTGRVAGLAATLGNLAVAERALGELRQAAEHQAQSLRLNRETGSRAGEAVAAGNLGLVLHDLGQLDAALQQLTYALTAAREAGDLCMEAETLNALALVHSDSGRHTEALELARAARALACKAGDRAAEAATNNTLGSIHLRIASRQRALDHHRRALALAHEAGLRSPEASALLGLSAADLHAGQPDPAARHARQALETAEQAGYRVLAGQAHAALAAALLTEGRHSEAAEHARQALDLHHQTGHRPGEVRANAILKQALDRADGSAGEPTA